MKVKCIASILVGLILLLANVAIADGWNRKTYDPKENGNGRIALRKLQNDIDKTLWRQAKPVNAVDITRSIYSHIGKMVKIKGNEIYWIGEIEKGTHLILISTRNPDELSGANTIGFLYHSRRLPDGIRLGKMEVVVYGYVLGMDRECFLMRDIPPDNCTVIMGNRMEILRKK